MTSLFAELPPELVNIILEYNGYHCLRNGKYMRQLNLDNKKYDELKRKPIIRLVCKNLYKFYIASFTKIKNDILYSYTISTDIYSNKIHWYMDVIRQQGDNIENEKTYHYVYDHNSKQHSSII